jgi:hypothetical protein
MRGNTNLAGPETIGLRALAFVAADSEALERFLALSGADGMALRAQASDPEFLSAVLDYLLANEPLLIAFCKDESLEPREVHLAAARLVG